MTVRFPYSPTKRPPIPAVILDVATLDGSIVIPNVSAFLDTAADATIVPLPLIQQLGVAPFSTAQVRGFGQNVVAVQMYRVRVYLPVAVTMIVDVLAHPAESRILVGRDILNQFRITNDGPNLMVEWG